MAALKFESTHSFQTMRIWIVHILLLSFSALHCDMGHDPVLEPPRELLRPPWVAGKITTGSEYPSYAIARAEVVVSWGLDSLSSVTDSSGKFILQELPRRVVTLRVTAACYDTVTLSIDFSTIDTAMVEFALRLRKGCYVPGDIILGFQDTTSLRTCVRFGDSKGLSIDRPLGFRFLTDSISADSAQNIQRALSGKSYLRAGSFYIKNGRLVVWYFRELTSDLLQDWEAASRQLGFKEISPTGAKSILSKVAIGSEHEWIRHLSGEPILRYVCLNGIGTISEPLPPNQRLYLAPRLGHRGRDRSLL